MKHTIYFITGINGFLGRTLAKRLLDAACEVYGLRLPTDKQRPLDKVIYYEGDVTKPRTLVPFVKAAAKKGAVLIHCAGIVSIAAQNPALWRVNVDGTRNLIDQCEKQQVKKIIYVSSVHAIPEKPNGEVIRETERFSASLVKGIYGKSKAEATAFVKNAARHGLPVTIVHPSGIIGPEDSSGSYMTDLFRFYVRHRIPLAIDGGYDFVDVRDVAEGILKCAQQAARGESYILSNEYITVGRIFDTLSRLTGKSKTWGSLPLHWIRPLAPCCEKILPLLGLPKLITPYSLYTLGSNGNFSHEKATKELGYQPRPLEETMADIVRWLQ